MPAKILQLADALKADLNTASDAGAFSQTFVATRKHRPRFKREDMATLHVTVMPGAIDMTPVDRTEDRHEYVIAVGVQKTFSSEADLDAMTLLVEEISDYIRNHRLTGHEEVTRIRTTNNPLLIDEHLQSMEQFTSFLNVTYVLNR